MFNPANIKREPEPKPPLILIYAQNGVGKSSFLLSVPGIIVADIEGKLNASTVARFVPTTYKEFKGWLEWMLNEEKIDFKAIGIDSIDWLESLIHKKICTDTGAATITDPYTKATGYGNGYILAANIMRNEVIVLLEQIRDKHNVPVIMVCHATVVTCKDPDIEPYDVHELKLHDKIRAVISERVEAKIYAKILRKRDDKGDYLPAKERELSGFP